LIIGSHTGHIQSLGGVADTSIGGGGAGGRIALYQNSHHTIPPYRGFFETMMTPCYKEIHPYRNINIKYQ
jgi:hypothetical protein